MAHQWPELTLTQPDPRAPTTTHGGAAWGLQPHHTGHQGWLAGQEPTTGVSEASRVLLVSTGVGVFQDTGVMVPKTSGLQDYLRETPSRHAIATDNPHNYVLLLLRSPISSLTSVTLAISKAHLPLSDYLRSFLAGPNFVYGCWGSGAGVMLEPLP